MIKDKDGNVQASSDNVLRICKEYFEGMAGGKELLLVRGKMREGVALKWQN